MTPPNEKRKLRRAVSSTSSLRKLSFAAVHDGSAVRKHLRIGRIDRIPIARIVQQRYDQRQEETAVGLPVNRRIRQLVVAALIAVGADLEDPVVRGDRRKPVLQDAPDAKTLVALLEADPRPLPATSMLADLPSREIHRKRHLKRRKTSSSCRTGPSWECSSPSRTAEKLKSSPSTWDATRWDAQPKPMSA